MAGLNKTIDLDPTAIIPEDISRNNIVDFLNRNGISAEATSTGIDFTGISRETRHIEDDPNVRKAVLACPEIQATSPCAQESIRVPVGHTQIGSSGVFPAEPSGK